MSNEEKLKLCIIPSCELRNVYVHGTPNIKIQQKFYNYDGTACVWRDIKLQEMEMKEFRSNYSFE